MDKFLVAYNWTSRAHLPLMRGQDMIKHTLFSCYLCPGRAQRQFWSIERHKTGTLCRLTLYMTVESSHPDDKISHVLFTHQATWGTSMEIKEYIPLRWAWTTPSNWGPRVVTAGRSVSAKGRRLYFVVLRVATHRGCRPLSSARKAVPEVVQKPAVEDNSAKHTISGNSHLLKKAAIPNQTVVHARCGCRGLIRPGGYETPVCHTWALSYIWQLGKSCTRIQSRNTRQSMQYKK